jgi:hypothetical protein
MGTAQPLCNSQTLNPHTLAQEGLPGWRRSDANCNGRHIDSGTRTQCQRHTHSMSDLAHALNVRSRRSRDRHQVQHSGFGVRFRDSVSRGLQRRHFESDRSRKRHGRVTLAHRSTAARTQLRVCGGRESIKEGERNTLIQHAGSPYRPPARASGDGLARCCAVDRKSPSRPCPCARSKKHRHLAPARAVENLMYVAPLAYPASVDTLSAREGLEGRGRLRSKCVVRACSGRALIYKTHNSKPHRQTEHPSLGVCTLAAAC